MLRPTSLFSPLVAIRRTAKGPDSHLLIAIAGGGRGGDLAVRGAGQAAVGLAMEGDV
jgi:hypothetical protein